MKKKMLEDLEKWLSNDKVKNEKYIKEIQDAKGLFSEYSYNNQSLYNNLNCMVQNNMFKRMDIYNNNCNRVQMAMINSIPKQSISKSSNQNQFNNNLFGNMNYQPNMSQAPLFQNMNQGPLYQNMNQAPLYQNMNQAPLFQNQAPLFQNMNQAPLYQNMYNNKVNQSNNSKMNNNNQFNNIKKNQK